MFLVIAAAGLILIAVLKLYKFLKAYLRLVKLSKQFAVPETRMLLGNAHLLLGIAPHEVVSKVLDIIAKCGKVMGFWFGPFIFCLFMMDVKSAESVLGSQKLLNKSAEYNAFKNWLCEGLLISEPLKWFKRRRILTNAFHFTILHQFIEIFNRNAHSFVQNLQTAHEKAAGSSLNIGHWVNLATLDVICGKQI